MTTDYTAERSDILRRLGLDIPRPAHELTRGELEQRLRDTEVALHHKTQALELMQVTLKLATALLERRL